MTTFRVRRTSDPYGSDHRPCEGATWDGTDWRIAIPTLAKLVKFVRAYEGRAVIEIESPHEGDMPQLMRLEIYDDYRE